MKKFLYVLLILALICTTASCGNDKEEEFTTTSAETTAEGLVSMETPEYDELDWGEFVVE